MTVVITAMRETALSVSVRTSSRTSVSWGAVRKTASGRGFMRSITFPRRASPLFFSRPVTVFIRAALQLTERLEKA